MWSGEADGLGFFYKWSDAFASMAGKVDALCKGFWSLEEAYLALARSSPSSVARCRM